MGWVSWYVFLSYEQQVLTSNEIKQGGNAILALPFYLGLTD